MTSWIEDRANEVLMVVPGAITAYPTRTSDVDLTEGADVDQADSLFAVATATTTSIKRRSYIKRLIVANSAAVAGTVTLQHHNGAADGASQVFQITATIGTYVIEYGGLRTVGWRVTNSVAGLTTTVVYALAPAGT